MINLQRILVYCSYSAPAIGLAFLAAEGDDVLPIITSLLVVFISIYGILSRPSIPFSLVKIVNTFSYLFLGIVPITTYKYSIDYWDAGPFQSSDYLLTNIVVIFVLIFFNSSYEFFYRAGKPSTFRVTRELAEPIYNKKIGLYLIGISSAISVYVFYLNGFDVINVWTRGKLGDQTAAVEYGQIQYLFFSFFLIPMLSINLLLYGMTRKRSRAVTFILTFLLLFTAPPTSMPRFAVAAMYIPLILWYFRIFWNKYVFSVAIVAALLVIFPLLEIFRYAPTDISAISLSDMVLSLFTGGHFDSYQSLMVVLKDETMTYGLQLVGALLFFLPRVIWPDKPVGSGQFMAEKMGFSFNNISANYFSEGYINFGYFGIVLFVLALAKFCGHYDKLWQTGRLVGSPRSIGLYLIWIPLIFFMLRGDLMSSFAFIWGFSFALLTIDYIIRLAPCRTYSARFGKMPALQSERYHHAPI